MNKVLTGSLIGLALVGGGLAGGSAYMGNKLESSYRNNFDLKNKRFQVQLKHFDMGAMSGKAEWTGVLTYDLCSPDNKITIRSEDTISRSLVGYTVVSKIYLVPGNGKPDVFLFDSDSTLGWTGSLNTKLSRPAGSHTETNGNGTLTVKWDAVNAQVIGKKEGDALAFSEISLNVPSVSLERKEDGSVHLKNFTFSSSTGWSFNADRLVSGKEHYGLESLTIQSKNDGTGKPLSLTFADLKAEGEQKVGEKSIDYTTQTSIGLIDVNGNKLDKIRLNGAVKGISLDSIKEIQALLKRQNEACVSPEEAQQYLEKTGLAIAKAGLSGESKGNQIALNGSMIKADATFSLPAGNYADTDELMRKLPEAVKYKADVVIDKGFVREIAKIGGGFTGRPVGDEEVEKGIQDIVQITQGRIEGDKILISKEKK